MRIGIDLGGTKIEGLALADDGRELARRRIAAPRGNYDDTIRAVVDLVDRRSSPLNALRPRRSRPPIGEQLVGIGIPGAISPATGLIKNANSTWLNGRPLDRDLARALERPVRLANDANCFALSEATDGAAAGAAVVFGVIIGTGTGGGLVVNGRVVAGANAIAGEWGHNPLPAPEDDERPGPALLCGRSGCIETFLSGPALARDYLAHGGDDVPPSRSQRVPTPASPRAIGLPRSLRAPLRARDRVGDQRRRSGRHRARRRIVEHASACTIACPRCGRRTCSPIAWTPDCVPAKHGDASGVRGAAWLWETGCVPVRTIVQVQGIRMAL